MESVHSDTKKSRLLIFMLVGLVAVATAVGVTYYQSTQQSADNTEVEVEFVNGDQNAENAAPAEKQNQPQQKTVAQKKESGSMLDKLKSIDIEVYGAKNPCAKTERMLKQCSD